MQRSGFEGFDIAMVGQSRSKSGRKCSLITGCVPERQTIHQKLQQRGLFCSGRAGVRGRSIISAAPLDMSTAFVIKSTGNRR